MVLVAITMLSIPQMKQQLVRFFRLLFLLLYTAFESNNRRVEGRVLQKKIG